MTNKPIFGKGILELHKEQHPEPIYPQLTRENIEKALDEILKPRRKECKLVVWTTEPGMKAFDQAMKEAFWKEYGRT